MQAFKYKDAGGILFNRLNLPIPYRDGLHVVSRSSIYIMMPLVPRFITPCLILLIQHVCNTLTATSAATTTPSSTLPCWYPDKSTAATDDRPCNNGNEGGFSACCGQDNICLTNGYCILGGVFINRGSCTDQSWSDGACPQQCREGALSNTACFARCSLESSRVLYLPLIFFFPSLNRLSPPRYHNIPVRSSLQRSLSLLRLSE